MARQRRHCVIGPRTSSVGLPRPVFFDKCLASPRGDVARLFVFRCRFAPLTSAPALIKEKRAWEEEQMVRWRGEL